MNNDFEINKMYHGFKLVKDETNNDIHSQSKLFKHIKSGAELIYISNEDNNKTFCISFKTPPKSDNGIAHIMEHSVLCGSKKYPVKDPFFTLVNSSLNTFLNAMTFSDKTMYPFASQNSKDFKNLLGIYLDAVFYPNLLKDSTILHQEGWHYHLENKTDELKYSGVVYGEMQGAFSSPESVLNSECQMSLFPDTCYNFESGGIPKEIPSLTQQEFEKFHQTYYHPSNSKLFIYGNGDIKAHLKYINDEYLSDFEKIEIAPKIDVQQSFDNMIVKEFTYPIPDNVDINNQYFLGLNFATDGLQNSRDL
ncbi:MAG: insulinase family protein, partial [Candidatus Cloacimonadota bacterium]|nr:insulinase family protein [Candidatus Cloacimonadota bacterium]